MNKMLIQLFLMPMVLSFSSTAVLHISTSYLPERLGSNYMFSAVIESITKAGAWASLAMLAVGLIWAVHSSLRLYNWYKGNSEACYNCGGLTTQRDGRYGLYHKCLACGSTRSI